MYRELLFIGTILGVASLGTEIVFRFRPASLDNDFEFSQKYINQSKAVIAATLIEILVSIYTIKVIDKITPIRMKIITSIVVVALITAIVYRSLYGYFLPLKNSQYNLYNATSFFICLTTIVWLMFWFFRKEEPLIDTIRIDLDERHYQERNGTRRREGVNRSSEDHIEGDILPSYYELPPPPIYVKDMPTPQAAHASTRASYQNNTATINILPSNNTSN